MTALEALYRTWEDRAELHDGKWTSATTVAMTCGMTTPVAVGKLRSLANQGAAEHTDDGYWGITEQGRLDFEDAQALSGRLD